MRALLPDFPAENIVAEPAKRDTAAAVALATGWVAARDHQATMVVLPADHVIKDTAAFQKTMRDGGARGGRNRRAGHDRDQANLGVPRIWLHRTGRAGAAAKRVPRANRFFAWCVFAKSRTPNWPTRFVREGKFPLERRHVCLVGADGAERIQPARAGTGRFHFADLARRKIGKGVARTVSASCRRSRSITRSWKKPIGS